MKKIKTFLLIATLTHYAFAGNSYCGNSGPAICTPGSYSTYGFQTPTDSLPCLNQGVAYQQIVGFKVPTLVGGITINTMVIDSISNLPCGICWATNKAGNTFIGDENMCFSFTGITNDLIGAYMLIIYGKINGNISGTFSTLGFNYYLRVKTTGATCLPAANLTAITSTGNVVNPTVLIATKNIQCKAAKDSFVATYTNGGTTPTFQWKKNGQNVGTNASVYEATNLQIGDSVWLEMTSSLPSCVVAKANSNIIKASTFITQNLTLTTIGNYCSGQDTLVLNGNTNFIYADWYRSGNSYSEGTTSSYNIFSTAVGTNGIGGSANNQLGGVISHIAIDRNNYLYVSDAANHRVIKFPPNSTSSTLGTIVAGGNGFGNAANQLDNPLGICFDKNNNLYVADFGNHRIQKFLDGSTQSTAGVTVAGTGVNGIAFTQTGYPMYVGIDSVGKILVKCSNGSNSRILSFPTNSTSGSGGTLLNTNVDALWLDPNGNYYYLVSGGSVYNKSGVLRANGLTSLGGVAPDIKGNLYLTNNNSVQYFPAGSNFNTQGIVLADGSLPNKFSSPGSICMDNNNTIYVADNSNYRVQRIRIGSPKIAPSYYRPGAYYAITTNPYGCKDTSNLLTINPQTKSSRNDFLCFEGSYSLGDSTLTKPGSYPVVFRNTNMYGCDSTINLSLNYYPFTTTILPRKYICNGSTLNFYGKTYTGSGFYSDTIIDTRGCRDSILQFYLSDTAATIHIQNLTGGFCPPDSIWLTPNNFFSGFNYTWSNGQTKDTAFVLSPGKYYVSGTSSNGCSTNKDSITISAIPNCGLKLILESEPIINYFDTIHLKVRVKNADNTFSIFSKLTFDNKRLAYLDSKDEGFLGTNIINQPAIATGGTIDFGTTKTNGQAGTNGDGLFYTFRFTVRTMPLAALIPKFINPGFDTSYFVTKTGLTLINPTINDATGAQRVVGLPPTDSISIRNYIPVWPGDLNNDKKVNVADILPIGYFYLGSRWLRPNASLTWKAQPAIAWDTLIVAKNSPGYKVFADGNGSGTIDLADQASIGFNLGNIHAKKEEDYYNPNRGIVRSGAIPFTVEISPTQLDSSQLPITLSIPIGIGTTSNPVSKLYGAAFDILFNPAMVDVANITTNYSNSFFGTLNADCIKQEDNKASQGRISVGITRYNTTELYTNGNAMSINLPILKTSPRGWLKVEVIPIAANDKLGNDIAMTFGADSVLIITNNTSPSAINTISMEDFGLKIYPNPATESLQLSFTKAIPENVFELNVCDVTGRIIQTQKLSKQSTILDISAWTKGIYMLRVKDGKGECMKAKLIKE